MGRFRNSHRRALEYIENHPELLSIEGVIGSAIEMKLRDRKRNLLTEADIVFFCTGKRVCLVEYKNGDKPKQLERANSQLKIASAWFRDEGYNLPACYFVDSKTYPKIYENMRSRTQRYNGTRQKGGRQNGT